MSLRRRIIGLVAASVLPLGAVLVADSILQLDRAEREANREAMQEARLVAGRMQAVLEGQQQLNRALIQYYLDQRPGTEQCSAYARTLIAGTSLYTNIVLMSPEGTILCGALPWPPDINVSDRYYFQAAMRTTGTVVGELIRSRLTGRWAIDVSESHRDGDGKVVVIASHVLDPEYLARSFAENFRSEGGFFSFLDRNGVVVLQVPDHARSVGQKTSPELFARLREGAPKTLDTSDMRGRPHILAFMPVQGDSLYVVFGIDREMELGPARQAMWRNIAIALAAILMVAFAGWWVGTVLIQRPVRALAAVAKARAAGDTTARFPFGRPNSELGQLAAELNRMAHALTSLVDQRTMLVREIQHRVMNSLQLLSAFLQLQSRNVEDPAARDQLRHARDRIVMMSVVYRHLYQGAPASTVEFGAFLRSFCADVGRAYVGPDSGPIDVDAVEVHLPTEMAVSVALMTHELITNALKHAYPAGQGGPIWVQLLRLDDGRLKLVVADQGKGLPEGFVPERRQTLGMAVIRGMAQQLGGSLVIERRTPGTAFIIVFQPTPAPPRPGEVEVEAPKISA